MRPAGWGSLNKARQDIQRALLILLILFGLGGEVAASEAGGQELPVSVLISDALVVPGADAAWREVATPHREVKPAGKDLVTYWYKADFIFGVGSDASWILLPRMRNGGKVFVNGIEVERLQESTPDFQMRWRHPQLLYLPISALHVGHNQIAIRTPSRELRTTFGGIQIGSETALRAMHDRWIFWDHTLNDLLSGAALCIGAFISVIWLYRRKERTFGLFGLSLLFWSAFIFLFRATEVPMVLFSQWVAACYFTLGGFFTILMLSLIRFYGVRKRWLTRVLMGHWLGSSLLYLAGGDAVRASIDIIWIAGFLPMLIYSFVLTVKATVRRPSMLNFGILIAFLMVFLALLHDYAARHGMFNLPESYRLHMAIPGLLIMAGMVAMGRYVGSLNRADRLRKEFARRLVSRDAANQAGYASLRDADKERVMIDERQRIMREMHDGIGSHLLSTLVIAQRGSATQDELVEMLKECVDEMRLTIDTFSPTDPDLLSILGNFRFRMESRFKAVGIKLIWRNHALPNQFDLGADAGLQVLRILQEALTNVLKHAGAQMVEITVTYREDGLSIRIRDDGVGISPVTPEGGQGLGNMRLRAGKIGAALSISRVAHGTEILLDVPVNPVSRHPRPMMPIATSHAIA